MSDKDNEGIDMNNSINKFREIRWQNKHIQNDYEKKY